MTTRRFQLASMLLAAALLLSAAAPALSAAEGKPDNGNNGNSDGKGNSGDNGKGNSENGKGKSKKPSEKVQGGYVIMIAGYYRGSGTADVTAADIKISATVKDPSGKTYQLTSGTLDITDDRFRGGGTLDGKPVEFDGRVDPADEQNPGNGNGRGNGVLKKGRITFAFVANGHRARGVGDRRSGSEAGN